MKTHFHPLSDKREAGEFGGTPMPGPKGCGRAIPSQAGGRERPLGVCNEQGPAPKGKVCSELHGNMQRSAEMTDPGPRVMIQRAKLSNKSVQRYSGYEILNTAPSDVISAAEFN